MTQRFFDDFFDVLDFFAGDLFFDDFLEVFDELPTNDDAPPAGADERERRFSSPDARRSAIASSDAPTRTPAAPPMTFFGLPRA